MSKQLVAGNQKAVDALALNSGTWRVIGSRGLYVRCRVRTKSFIVRRRVNGKLIEKNLGELSVRDAKDQAAEEWAKLEKPKPSLDGSVTLGSAIDQYIGAKTLAPKTIMLARYNKKKHLLHWDERTLHEIGRDRAGVRLLQQRLTKEHGAATSNQVVRLLSAVYRWHRKVNPDLAENPMVVCEIHRIKARDWAYSDDELKAWWSAPKRDERGQLVKKDDKPIMQGVSTLGAVKKMWWLTALFTGARKGSIEALKWSDVDLEKKAIHFRVTKGDRPYGMPMADKLADLLTAYRTSDDVPPSEWVFPSPSVDGAHLVDVKNHNEGVGPAHRLRHTFRTALAQIGATPDAARMLMGHSMGGDVSRNYITSSLVVESLRPLANAVAERYVNIIGLAVE